MMMDVPLPGEESPKKKISLTFMPSKLLNLSSIANEETLESGGEKEPGSPLVQTDDFLTIIPKPTLLGKQQAKKRLQAFSASKQQLPAVRKLPEVRKEADKVEEEKRAAKRIVKPDDRAKTTIEEIEAIKKLEIELGHYDPLNRLRRVKPAPKEFFDKNFKYDKHFSISKDSKDSRDFKHFEREPVPPPRQPEPAKYEKREKTKHSSRDGKQSEREHEHSKHERSGRYSERDVKPHADRNSERESKHSERDGRDSRHSSGRHSRHVKKEPRNWEKEKYPANWKDVEQRELSLDDVKLIELSGNKRPNNINQPIDIVRMAKFLLPNYPMIPLKYKKADGQTETVPPQILRYTMKNGRVSYSGNPSRIKNIYFNRNMMFDIVSKEHKDSIKALIAQSSQSKPVLPSEKPSVRKWYPKTPFSAECEILEQSLGLSILQNCYSEEDEPEPNAKPAEEEEENETKSTEEKSRPKGKSKDREKQTRSERKKEKKVKKRKKRKLRKIDKKKKSAEDKPAENTKPEDVPRSNDGSPPAVDLVVGSGTPDTDEYHSHWESDEDLVSAEKVKKENCWESEDEDVLFGRDEVIAVRPVIKTYNRAERSLEMPLNINISRSRISDTRKTPPETHDPKKKSETPAKANRTSEYSKKPKPQKSEAENIESHKKHDSFEHSKHKDLNKSNDSFEGKSGKNAYYNESIDLPELKARNDMYTKADFNEDYMQDSSNRSDFSGFNSEIRELVLARKSLSEERRQLEEEKRLIEERGKKIDLRERSELLYDENKVIKVESFDEVCLESSGARSRLRKSRWEDPIVTVKEEKFAPEPAQNSQSNTSSSWEKVNLLETEYEQFMRAVQSDVKEENVPDKEDAEKPRSKERKSRKRKVSTTSSSAVSSRSSSSSSASNRSAQLFNNHDICLDDVPLPQPLPVPSPKTECVVDSTSSPLKKTNEPSQIDLENRKPLNSIIIAKKATQLIDNNLFKDSDESDGEKTPAPELVNEGEERVEERKSVESQKKAHDRKSEERDNSLERLNKLEKFARQSEEKYYDKAQENKKSCDDYKLQDPRRSDEKRHKSDQVRRSEEKHVKNHRSEERKLSPKRRKSSTRRHSRSRYSSPPPRKNRGASPRRRYRDRFSPRRSRDRSPRKSPQPYRRRSRSPHKETIQETLSRLAGLEPPSRSRSPVDSPLDGFRKSLADSTISDEQLMQNQEHYSSESPRYSTNPVQFKHNENSPKRIPLEERINRVLGIDKEDEPKPISTTYSQDYSSYSYYDEYGNYMDYDSKHFGEYVEQPKPEKEMLSAHANVSQVVQVGNVLQVVPTDEIPVPVNTTIETEIPQQILQVGNMLQIVPVPTMMPVEIVPSKEVKSAEDVMKQKAAELRAEREKRRVEREVRRKEKEKKRKEREKRRQLKIKQKTEDVIKKALLMETEENEDEREDNSMDSKQWMALSSIVNMGNRPVGKSILVRKRSNEISSIHKKKKGVKFADGVIPGEGTSPSGGEELSSPPPMPFKGIKEKRFTKTKKPKKIKQPKKKIKVKVIRKALKFTDEEEDHLPPPSPPPGSPPPHVYPPRIKPIPNPNYLAPQSTQPHLSYPFPPSGRGGEHYMQGTPPNALPTFPPNMTSVPPPNIPLHPPPQMLGQPPPSYPPPPLGMHLPPLLHHHSHPTPGGAHQQGQTGRPILVKQSFNSSISPPQHMLGPHNG